MLNIAANAAGIMIHLDQSPIEAVYRRIKFCANDTPLPDSIPLPVPYIVIAPRVTKNIAVITVIK